MKAFLLAILIIFSFSCKKSNISEGLQLPGVIKGVWELHSSMGGFAGNVNYPSGNGIIFSFDGKSTFYQSNPSEVTMPGTYTLDKASAPNDWILQLHYTNGNFTVRDSVHIESNQLVFFPLSPCCDMPATIYLKKNIF